MGGNVPHSRIAGERGCALIGDLGCAPVIIYSFIGGVNTYVTGLKFKCPLTDSEKGERIHNRVTA